MNRLEDYANKCSVLRQIMSNKAQKYRKINAAQNFATVVVSSFLLFIGFSGTETIYKYVSKIIEVEATSVGFGFNILVFSLFLLGTLHLVFHFGKKQADAERAIVFLSNVINQIEDMLWNEEIGNSRISNLEVDMIRQKYESVIQIIPANTDKEFHKAKKDFIEKQRKRNSLTLSAQNLFIESENDRALIALIRRSSEVMDILKILRDVSPNLYLGGGIVRNAVWDFLHGYSQPTPVDDVDVVYFNKLSNSKEHDIEIENSLKLRAPNLRWSVKNQARMHHFNNEPEYQSIEDAIEKWPETATAIAIKLEETGEITTIKPHGLSDLFRLIVRPTPHFQDRKQRIMDRLKAREWIKTWPKLKSVCLDIPEKKV